MKNINFKLPKKIEGIGIFIMFISLFAMYQSSNLWLSAGINWKPHLFGDIVFQGSIAFYISFFLFLLATLFTLTRSILIKSKYSTWNTYDFIVGFFMIFGLYVIAISTIFGVFGSGENIVFLFNLPYLPLMNLAFFVEALGMLWFGFTD